MSKKNSKKKVTKKVSKKKASKKVGKKVSKKKASKKKSSRKAKLSAPVKKSLQDKTKPGVDIPKAKLEDLKKHFQGPEAVLQKDLNVNDIQGISGEEE